MRADDFGRVRLANQLLTGTGPREVAGVVAHMLAMQAQDYRQSLWAVGARLSGGAVADVERALETGAVVRSWPMRGTIHLMAADDVRWLVALCAPRMLATDARRLAQLDLTEKDVRHAEDLIRAALSGQRLLGRSAMMGALRDGGIATTGQRGYHLLWRLGQQGVICIGPTRGGEQTFALLDAWLPPSASSQPGLDRDQALVRLASRFAGSRGPVTAHDLARWSGLTVSDARRGLHATDLPRHEVDGRQYWAPDVRPSRTWRAPLLLAGFDEYLIGYQGRDELIDPAHASKVVPGGNGVFKPMVVAGGRIVAVWKRSVTTAHVTVQVMPFEHGAVPASALRMPVQRYRRFFGLPPATVTVG